MEIAESARKHGVPDDDIRHAVRNELRTISQGDRLLIIGPSRDVQLLEVVVLDTDDDLVAIHAMPLRAKFFHFLR